MSGDIVKVHFNDMQDAAQFAAKTKQELDELAAQILKRLTIDWQGLSGDTFANERTKFINAMHHIDAALGGLADLINNQIASDLHGTDGSTVGVLDGVASVPSGMASSSFSYVSAGLNNQ
ncbi:MAG: hypothetical protein HOV71_11660 [Hamadaea sp.]|uniref:hypothetical protein n=1 Tax=Hamadaea sp. NPDC050747 TaxID=3155789 RepID=UPI001839AE7D|nr:hypothetical protein [Hamadaea sp.]NUR48783.1 hypothetical protein [Hamadaea sp.]NUT05489.1 hypothetical protein [Hamadaea sp.]